MFRKRSLNFADWLLTAFTVIAISVSFSFNWWSERPFWRFDWWGGVEPIGYWYPLSLFIACYILRLLNLNYVFITLALLGFSYVMVATITPIVAIIFIWITAYLVGRYLSDLFAFDLRSELIILAGLGMAVIGLAITIASHFKVNYSQIYAAIFLCLDILLLRRYQVTINFLKNKYFEIGLPSKHINVLLGAILVATLFHLFTLSLMPDMGHDSLSTHLTIPRQISESHFWGYNVREYIWSVEPMGADMLFVPAYMFGGEDGIRLLNISFIVCTSLLIYRFARLRFKSLTISAAFAIAYLSLPIIYYSLGQAFIEPCYAFFMASAIYLLIQRRVEWYAVAMIIGYAASIKFSALIFYPLIVLIYLFDIFTDSKSQKLKKSLVLVLTLFLFGSLTFIYAFMVTGNPIFPLMNEVFKSNFMYKEAFYNPIYANKEGLSIAWKFIFESKKYGEFYYNGTLGIFYAIFVPSVFIILLCNVKDNLKMILVFSNFIFFIFVMFNVQAYLRYIYPALTIIFFASIYAFSQVRVNKKMLLTALGVVIAINFVKSSLASNAFRATPLSFYMSNEGRQRYVAKYFPFAPIGELLATFPEFNDKKILLVGYGVDPMYYHYPKGTASYSWHSLRYFDSINKNNGVLDDVIRQEGIEYIVCPSRQHKDDKFKFSEQCKNLTNPIITLNDVYVGSVKNATF